MEHAITIDDLKTKKKSIEHYLIETLLPFWLERAIDANYGGYITHFDGDGIDSGEDEKSLIAQTRTVYTFSSAFRSGYGDERCREAAAHGVDFLINRMWDDKHGGFFWTADRTGKTAIDAKIVYGHSFAIYALSEYTLATGDPRGFEYAAAVFDLLQKYGSDTRHGGYFEMFERDWNVRGPGAGGGDRKTLDAHMHLMEAFTTLFEVGRLDIHRRKLLELIAVLAEKIMHPEYGTGIPQFLEDWTVAPQIKFDIVWGWDRFVDGGVKQNAEDNTSAGHNVEFAWLLLTALDTLGVDWREYAPLIRRQLNHAADNGIDWEYGGVYVEGPHSGGVTDREKEFWQQVEVMIGMLEAFIRFGDVKYLEVYRNVHDFLFNNGINYRVGELWPLLTREGKPIWTHMSHSWKVNYHSVRGMIQCARRLDTIIRLELTVS